MGSISVQVLHEKDYKMVLAMLKALEENEIISVDLDDEPNESIALPGKALTEAELNEIIAKAENGPKMSHQEFKEKYGL